MTEDLENWLDEHDPTHLGDRLAILQMRFMAFAVHPDPVVSNLATHYLKQVNKMLQDINNVTENYNISQGGVDSD